MLMPRHVGDTKLTSKENLSKKAPSSFMASGHPTDEKGKEENEC
jgi:hypothetical protein